MFRHLLASSALGTFCVLFALPVWPAGAASSPAAGGEPTAVTGKVDVADPATRPGSPPIYGPILSRDPHVRAQIKRLYLDQTDLVEAMQVELLELSQALRAEPDPDFRAEIHRDVAQVKMTFQLQHMELGLEIARLNGDARRVAEFELALDQVRHPEKYRPAPRASSVRVERSPR